MLLSRDRILLAFLRNRIIIYAELEIRQLWREQVILGAQPRQFLRYNTRSKLFIAYVFVDVHRLTVRSKHETRFVTLKCININYYF